MIEKEGRRAVEIHCTRERWTYVHQNQYNLST